MILFILMYIMYVCILDFKQTKIKSFSIIIVGSQIVAQTQKE